MCDQIGGGERPKNDLLDTEIKIFATHAATALTGMGCSVAATIGAFFVSATPTKSATSIETCLVIRNTGDHEAHSLRTFVVSWRQF